jgi:hypothetical protein
MSTIAWGLKSIYSHELEFHYGLEAPGYKGPAIDGRVDGDDLWLWFFGRELVVSRKPRRRTT